MNSYANAISTKSMSREEWIDSRRKGIGGSDVAAILGFNAYKTALDVYFEKTAEQPIETPMNARMKAGMMLEDVVADWFSEESGLVVRKDNKIRIHKSIPYLIGNVDRMIVGNNGDGPGVLEIKTTSGFVARNWEVGEVPLNYFAQLQHYLNVTGYQYGYFAVLVDGFDFRMYRMERDEEFIQMMTHKLMAFWLNVEEGNPPEPSNEEDLRKVYTKHSEGLEVEATDETYKHYQILAEVKNRIKELEEQEQKLKESLMLVMKDAECLTHNGSKIITWKTTKDKETFDSKTFKAELPDIYAKYKTTSPGSRIFKVIQ